MFIAACASIGSPDGGPYDETPPVFLGSTPEPMALNVKDKRVTLEFDEFIKLEKASEKVVISPPQLEQPEIKVLGKKVVGEFLDELKDSIMALTEENANIEPKELRTMLYPKFINTESPIKGKVDYSEYEGTSLDWSFAYANKDEVDITITDDVIVNSTSQYKMGEDSVGPITVNDEYLEAKEKGIL